MMNTNLLLDLVDASEDAGLECEYVWNAEYDGVLNGVVVDGEYIENEEIESDIELANESGVRYDGDTAAARSYYFN